VRLSEEMKVSTVFDPNVNILAAFRYCFSFDFISATDELFFGGIFKSL
jgi:hypothetical protein